MFYPFPDLTYPESNTQIIFVRGLVFLVLVHMLVTVPNLVFLLLQPSGNLWLLLKHARLMSMSFGRQG